MADHGPPARRRKARGIPGPAMLADRVRAERLRLGLTQVEAGRRLGINHQTYGMREKTTRLPYDMALEMILTLGMDPRALYPELFRDGP
jgi:transcriptional regulator with XRE-family HTH domain